MVFSELTFIFVFLPAVALIYYICPRRGKNSVLFVMSLLFYGWGELRFLPLMLVTIALHYFAAIIIEKLKPKSGGGARAALIVSVCVSLLLLGLFKYSDFAAENFNSVFGTSLPLPGLSLPIGISFYTFQTLSYTIDVYRGLVRAQKNFINLGAYISFFPQLIAGPIVQYKSIESQLSERKIDYEQIMGGISRFAVGLSKKVLLANRLGAVWDEISGIGEVSALSAWIGIICFTFQIYFDFSGYSDMAVGLGKMFGFEFPENFRYPYSSASITDFWRRWHITLGVWFREYVYIPMGGNRCSTPRQIFNIAVVWFLTGLWHGASWNFVLWGMYFAVLLLGEKLLWGKLLKRAPRAVGMTLTAFAVIFGWVLFSADSLSSAARYLSMMFGSSGRFADSDSAYFVITQILLITVSAVGCTELPARLARKAFTKFDGKTSGAVLTALLSAAAVIVSAAFLVGESYNPFLYFRF